MPLIDLTEELIERFWSKVEKTATCWIWTKELNSRGYGRMSVGRTKTRRRELAHRLSYRLSTGTLPGEMDVLHRCDRPSCVNPSHLFLGSAADNAMDMVAKGRARNGATARTTCPKGHPYDKRNSRQRICSLCLNQGKARRRRLENPSLPPYKPYRPRK